MGHGGETDRAGRDRETVPAAGTIQPYGLVLIADLSSHIVVGGAGDIEERLTPAWLGRPIAKLLAQDVDAAVATAIAEPDASIPLAAVPGRKEAFDAFLLVSGSYIVVDLEPRLDQRTSALSVLAQLEAIRTRFASAPDLASLCEYAARALRALTGFDRVMIYRMTGDGEGVVVAEDRHPDFPSLLNCRFPSAAYPWGTRNLAPRNRFRSIPDADYVPAPIRSDKAGVDRIDLSGSGLRGLMPSYIQYLKSMGVAASATLSIVREGALWGVISCHNATPRALDFDVRAAARAFGEDLAREIGVKEDAEIHRERVRLRGAENALVARFDQDAPFERFFMEMADDIRDFLGADGFAAVSGDELVYTTGCPEPDELLELARWARARTTVEPLVTDALAERFPPAGAYQDKACGLLALTLPTQASTMMMWFRGEQQEAIEREDNRWGETDEFGRSVLFTQGRETPRGRARGWTAGEVDAATRLRRSLFGMRQSYRVRELSRMLAATAAERDYLRQAVDRRVRNSLELLQMASGFEAGDQVAAVALVHRCLGQPDQGDAIDLAGYIDALIAEMRASMGDVARGAISLDLTPMPIAPDRAATIGLILVELIADADRRAGDAEPGPITIDLESVRGQLRLSITDQGAGEASMAGELIEALVRRLAGAIVRHDARPGKQVIVTAPIERR